MYRNDKETEKSLKRFLKKKFSFTASLLVAFLITGSIGLATSEELASRAAATQDELLAQIAAQKADIQAMLDANNARLKELDRSKYELIREGNDYSKPIYPSSQIFLNYTYLDGGKAKNNTKDEWKKSLDAIKEVRKASAGGTTEVASPYVEGTTVGSTNEALGLLTGVQPNGKPTAVGANGVVSIEEGQALNLDLGVNITPLEPTIPSVEKEVNANVTISDVSAPTFAVTAPTAPAAPAAPSIGVSVNVTAPDAVAAIAITAPTAPSPQVPGDKTIAVEKPATPDPFEPKMITPPSAPAAPVIATPAIFTPPTLPFVGKGFGQGAVVDMPKTYLIMQNYDSYTVSSYSTPANIIEIVTGASGTTWSGGVIKATTAVPFNATFNTSGPGSYYLNPGTTGSLLNAFINELRDHNMTMDGNYSMEYTDPDSNPGTKGKIFISHNPAGLDGLYMTNGNYDGNPLSSGEKKTTFNGELTLKGLPTTAVTDNEQVLIGIEHQHWDANIIVNYSTFENAGKITLASGKNVIGIMIDVELNRGPNAAGALFNTSWKHTNNKTTNTSAVGKGIFLNGTNSIGIDFGNYATYTIQDDVTLGNITVSGTENYGFRMKNLKDGLLAVGKDYYDDVTISGGSGTITVAGTKNVGLAIGKSLSSAADPYSESGNPNWAIFDPSIGAAALAANRANPISNFIKVNVKTAGTQGIGFLRQADYSSNNSGDFVLGTDLSGVGTYDTMGTFDIGDGSEGSTLIRSDYKGIKITGNITTTGTTLGTTLPDADKGNIIAHANNAITAQRQYIINEGNITSDMPQTTALAGTGTATSTTDDITNTGNITLKGAKSVGIMLDANSRGKSSVGTIKMTGSEGNAAVANLGNMTFEGNVEVNGKQSSGLYNKGTFNLSAATDIKGTNGATGIFGEAGTFTSTIGNALTIDIDDSASATDKGVAVYVKSGALINISGADINVLDGASGIASDGAGSNVDFSLGTLTYEGDGFALYTSNTGKIDAREATLNVDGNATGLQVDMADPNAVLLGGLPATPTNKTKINVLSTTATGVNIKNLGATVLDLDAGDTTVAQLNTALGTALSGVDWSGSIAGYTQAAIENGTFNINDPLDKSVTTGESAFFYRNLIVQAIKLNVKADITAQLSTAQAMDFNSTGQVAALEMNASKQVTGLAQTQINIDPGVTVKAGRTDSGAGAIGAFINYGQMKNEGTIEIENAQKNEGGVGIYAVNGATVDNSENITVYGDKGIGILGTAYREISATSLAGQEFSKPGEGETAVTNNKDIIMDGDKAVGIYMQNNSAEIAKLPAGTPATPITVVNAATGNIKATGDKAAGIYAEGNGTIAQTTVNNDGTIEVGKDGVGIFVDKAVDVQKVGTLKLGEEAIGVVLDKNSNISDTTTITATATTPTGNKMIVALKSDTAGTNDPAGQTLMLDIDISTLDNGTAIYVWDRGSAASTVLSTGPLTIGNNGVGIYVENGHATNAGMITLDPNGVQAVGMYTKNGEIDSTGSIDVNKNGQIGMVSKSATGIINNSGIINLNADVTTGIFVKDGATATDASMGNIVFATGTKSFGVASDNANVILNGGIYNTLDNIRENIYVFAENGSNITLNGPITVDGVAPAGAAKSIGIYMDGVNNLSSSNVFTAKNGIVGVYSNGANVIDSGSYTAEDDKTVGIYMANGGELKNLTVNASAASGSVVGVYGAAGTIQVTTGLALNLAPTGVIGTGMYLENGASVTGDPITITNLSTDTNAGIYYTGTGSATHGSDLAIMGSKVVGIFADNGIQVSNAKAITYAGTDNVGAFVAGGATYNSSSTADNVSTPNSIGIYTENGSGKNSGTLTVSNTTSAAVAAKTKTAGTTATAENSGTINVTAGLGMLVGDITTAQPGSSLGKNTGTIAATAGGATGVAVGLGDSKFDGTGGTINVAGAAGNAAAGIYLNNTAAGQVINAGTINTQNNDSVGIFANNGALVDFPVILTGTAGVGVFADNGAIISGNIDGSGSTDTIAVYMNGATGASVTFNNAVIKAGKGITGSAAGILMNNLGAYTLQNVTVIADGANSVGASATNGTALTYNTEITADNEAVGVYIDATSSFDGGGTLNIGNKAIGAYIDGGTGNIGTTNNININFTSTNGTAIYSANNATVNLGSNITITGTGSLAATENGSQTNTGTMTVENGSVGLIGQYDSSVPGYSPTYSIANTGIMDVKTGAIALAAVKKPTGASPAPGDVIVSNSNIINVQDAGSVGMYSDVANITNAGGTINVTDGAVGIYAKDNGNITDLGDIQVTKGTGIVIDGNAVAGSVGTITVNDGDSSNYSVGALYRNVSSISSLPNIALNGNFAVAAIAQGTTPVTFTNPITIGTPGGANHDQIFLKVQGDIPTNTPIVANANTVSVYGDKNIGIYGDTSNITVTDVTVGDSSSSTTKDTASIGVYGVNSDITANNVTVGNNSIGLYANNVRTAVTANNITVGEDAVGVYATGDKTTKAINISGTVDTANNKSLGIYGKDIDVNTTNTVNVGNNGSLGIVSEGTGNVTTTGSFNVASVATKGNREGAIAVYKKGDSGTITTSGSWTIGDEGYGIYAEQSGAGGITINNNADIYLQEASVAIYANGNTTVNNGGHITVGPTNFNGDPEDTSKHQNSVGMYVGGGAKAVNTGIIDVLNSHSAGIYGKDPGTDIANNGVINVDNGGTGILVKLGANATNNGIINILSGNPGAAGKVSVGIAAYAGSVITNSPSGVINAGDGTGMYVGTDGSVDNQGVINVANGIGITGQGTVINQGTINVAGSGSSYLEAENAEVEKGSVRIDKDGNVYVNENYVGLGGTIIATNNVIMNGAYFGIEQFTNSGVPVVETSGVISGDVRLLPDFTTYGNGRHWVISNFTDFFNTPGAASKITITTSPMFLTQSAGPDLILYKRPYADMVIGSQFDNLYNGLDSLLPEDGSTIGNKDFKVLTGFNSYLENINNTQGEIAYNKALAQGLAETRGDIYSTSQKRMSDIQKAFDDSFEEMVESYNNTKDVGKYSVIYQNGKYKDPTLGIDDYDYSVMGLMYMKEFDTRHYGNKWGIDLGFTVSKFKFDDAQVYDTKSKEDVYSVRAGLHNVLNLDGKDTLTLLTRLEAGYNRHEATRVMEMDNIYKNKGNYSSYNVTLDNKLEKVLLRDYKHKIGIYGALDLEYGKINDFSEKAKGNSGLELNLKDRDYFSAELIAGVNGHVRGYIGKSVSVKLAGDVGYGYELNDSAYARAKARIKNGTEDYYDLIRPEKEKGNIRGKVGLSLEKANHLGLTFDVTARKHDNKKDADLTYGVKLKYAF